MLTRPPIANLFNEFFDLAWLILGEENAVKAESTWKQIEAYRKLLEKRLLNEESTPKAIKSCELNLSILLEVIFDIRMSEHQGICQYQIYSRKLSTLKFLLLTSPAGQHPVVDAYNQFIHIFILLLNTVYTPEQTENNYQTLLWNSINIISLVNKFKLDFTNHQLNPEHIQAIPGLNPDILSLIYNCLDVLVTDRAHKLSHECVGFMGANMLLKRFQHTHHVIETSHPEPASLARQIIKSKKMRLDAVMLRLNLTMDEFKPLRIASKRTGADNITTPLVLTSVSLSHSLQSFYDYIRALTVRLISCSHIFISNQITHGAFDAENQHEHNAKQKKFALNHEAMTLQLENILCDAWLLHGDALLALTAAAKNDVMQHLDRIIRYAEGMLYQTANTYYVNRVGRKIAESTLQQLDFRNSQSTYDLASMSHTKRQLGVIYCSAQQSGLQLEFCGLNEKVTSRMIPWTDLPNDFPKNVDVLLKEKSKYLYCILDHPSLIGYILPLDGLSCLANSILRSRSEMKLGQAQNEEQRLAHFTELNATIIYFMEQVKLLEQQTSQNRLFVMKQFIADYFFAHLLLCNRISEFCELTKSNLCVAIDDLVSNTPNHSLYSFVQARHILKLNGEFSAQEPNADVKPLAEITDNDFMSLVESQQIICTTAAPQIFNPVWIYFYNDIKSMIERNTGTLANELHKRLKTYRSSLENSLQLAVQTIHLPVIADKSSFVPKSPETKVKRNKPKGKKKNTHKAKKDKAKINVTSPIQDVYAFFNYDPELVINFYQGHINTGKDKNNADSTRDMLYALIGLASCCDRAEIDDRQADRLRKYLHNTEELLFQFAAKYLFAEEAANFKDQYTKIAPKKIVAAVKATNRKAKVTAAETAKFKTFKPATVPPKPKKSSLDFMEDIRKPHELTINLNSHDACILKLLHESELYPLLHGGVVVDTLFNMQPRDIDMLCFADESTSLKTLHTLNIKGYRTHISKNNANVFSIYFICDDASQNKDCTEIYINDANNPQLRIKQPLHYEYKLDVSFIDPKLYRTRMEALKVYATGFGINWTLYYDYFAKLIYDPLHQLEIITKNKEIDIVFDNAATLDAEKIQAQFNTLIQSNPTLLVYIIEKSIRFEKEGIKISKRLSDLMHQLPKTSDAQQAGPSTPHKPFISTSRIRKLFLTGNATKAYKLLKTYCLIPEIFPGLKGKEDALYHACELMDARHNKNIIDAFSKHNNYHYQSITESDWCKLEAEFLSSALYAPCVAFLEAAKQTNFIVVEKECARFLHQCKFYIVPETKQQILTIWERELRMKTKADVTPFVPRSMSLGGSY